MRKLGFILLAALGACGDDGDNKKVDAGTQADSQDIDAPGSNDPVKITITQNGTAMAGIRVHFQNPDSSLIVSSMTDANGVASSPMPNGGFVTAINPYNPPGGTSANLYTYSDVEPGDELILADKFNGGGLDITFSLPADSTSGVTGYIVSTPCGDTSTTTSSVTLAVDERCATTTDVLVTSVDVNDEIVGWFYAADVATAGGSVDFSARTYTASTSKTFTYNNIPVASTGVEFGDEMHSAKGKIIEVSGGGEGTSVTQTLKLTPFTNALEIVFTLTGAPHGLHAFADWAPFSSTGYTVDVGARLLREATAGVSWDAANHEATWTEATTGVVPDLATASMQCFRTAGTLYIYWDVVGRYDGPAVKFPTLPVETTDYNCASTDTPDVDVTVAKVPGGFAAVRESFFAIENPQDLATSTAAGITFQEIGNAGGLFAPLKRAVAAATGRGNRRPFAFRRR